MDRFPPQAMTILFRADAHKDLGSGHLMRCLSLAHAMRTRGWSVAFLTCPLIPSYAQRVRDAGCDLYIRTEADDATEAERIAKEIHANWIVLDGYFCDAHYQKHLKSAGLRILCIDDQGAFDAYEADIILNQNISAQVAWYGEKAPDSRLLLGPEYALLGPQFTTAKRARVASTPVRNILVTLGGADPKNITLNVLHALEMLPQAFSVDVVIGGVNLHRNTIESYAGSMKHPVTIIVDAKNMPSLMGRADIAIAAAGTTTWELLFMGVPFITGAFANNQRDNAETLGTQNFAVNVGWYPDISETVLSKAVGSLINDGAAREHLATRGPLIVDGKGVERVCDALSTSALTLRDATMADARLLWQWANDPSVRASSFSPEPIAWEAHEAWLKRKLADSRCTIYVGEDGDTNIGQIRFDVREDGDAEVDVHTAPATRGKGYGSTLIAEGVRQFFTSTRAPAVHAFIKTNNAASKNAFLKAGFTEEGEERMQNEAVYHLLYRRP